MKIIPDSAQLKRKRNEKIQRKVRKGSVLFFVFFVSILGSRALAEAVKIQSIDLEKKDFSAQDEIVLDSGFYTVEAPKVELINQEGESIVPAFEVTENDEIVIKDPEKLEPGKYKYVLYDGKQVVFSENFTWGVLAINTNKGVYAQGDKVDFAFAVLNNVGDMVCDAELELVIENSENNERVTLKTPTDIKVNPQCNQHEFTLIPDYEANYKPEAEGTYNLTLKAKTESGDYTITDQFKVEKKPEFDVARESATRLYPLNKYPMKITIKANKDFKGQVVETIPDSFDLEPNVKLGKYDDEFIQGDERKIVWNVDLEEGEEEVVGYVFDPPNISPELFRAGKLKFVREGQVIMEGLDAEVEVVDEEEQDSEEVPESSESSQSESEKEEENETNEKEDADTKDEHTESSVVENVEITEFEELRYWLFANDAAGSADATRLYTTGFELNSTTAGMEYDENVNSPAISSSTYRSGAYALNTALGADSTEGIGIQFVAADSGNAFAIRTYLRVATLPGGTEEIIQILDTANTVHLSVRMTTSGALQLYSNTSSVQIGSDSSALSTNTWYRIELLVDSNGAGSSKMALRIDGVELTRTTTGTIGGVASSVAKVRVGILTSGQADLFWDDIAVNQDGYTNADHYPGEGKIVYLRPNGNGTLDECAGDYTALDETPPNDATDIVTCDVAADDDTYTMTDSSTAGIGANDYIKLMEAWSRHAGSAVSAGARTHTMTFKNGGTTDVNTAISVNSTSYFTNDDGTPRNADHIIYDAVGTTNYGPITIAEVDALEITISTPDATPDVFFTAIWVMVEYVPAEGGRLFSSGFELQSTAAGMEWSATTGTMAINTSTFRSGLAALEIASLGSGTEESLGYHYMVSGSDTNGPLFYRAYLYITTAPGAENRIIEVKNNAGTTIAYITLDNNRLLKLYDEDGAVGSASSALSTTTWYRIEMKVDASGAGSTDTVEAKIEGLTFATDSTRNLSSGTRSFYVGGNLNGEANTTGSLLFDDIAINKNAGSTQNSYPGYGRIAHLKPNGNGTATAWTNTYTNNDEVTPNDGTDLISISAVNSLETHNLQDSSTYSIPSTATITLAATGIRFLNATAVSAAVVRVCGDSSCLSVIESDKLATSANTWYTNQTADPMTPPLTMYSETNESTALTTTALDALQLGVRLEVDGGTNLYSVSTLWMLVEYNDSITISGTCDAFDQSTDCGDTGTLRFAVNGNLQWAGQETVAGTWSITGVSAPATNDIITVFIDGASDSDEAVNVTKYDGTNGISGVILYKEHLVIGSGENQSMTNTNLGQYDNSVSGDEDIFHDVSSGNLTVDSTAQSSTEELYIDASDTFTPGGTVTTHDIEIDGTFTAEANAVTVGGSWDNDSNFTSSGTVTFSATSGSETIDSTGSSTNSFNALVLGTGSGTATWTLGSALDVNSTLTISYGTLSNGSNAVTVAGNVLIDSNGNYTKGSGSFTFDGTTATTYTNTNSTITFDAASSAVIGGGDSFISWSHSVAANSNRILVVGVAIRGNVAVNSVTYNGDALTFAREDHPGSDVRTEIWYLLTPDTGTNTVYVTLASSQSAIGGAVSYYNVGSVGTAYGDGDSGLSDTISSVVSSSATGELVVDAVTYQNGNDTLAVGLNQTSRVLDVSAANNALGMSEEAGSPSVNSDWVFTANAWAGTSLVLKPAATLDNLGTVIFNKTDSGAPATNNKVTLASSMVTDNVTINGTGGSADTLDLASSGYILEMRNAGSTADVLTVSGTLTIGTSTIKFSATNSGGNINVNNLPYNSLQISGGDTNVLTGNQTSSNAITGNLTIDYGATLDVTATPYNITLEDNWSNWGTFTPQTGTVTIAGSGTSTIKGTTTFYTFTSTTASKTIKFQKYIDTTVPYFTFSNSFLLTGGGVGTEINLESDTASSQWLANFSSAQSGSTYVNVKDGGCYSGTSDIDLTGGTNVSVSGNDTSCWVFVNYIDIQGICKASDRTTDCGDTGTVKVAVNGTLQAQEQTTVAGTWTISSVAQPSAGAIITVFIDGAGETDEAVAVAKYNGSGNITSVPLYKEHLSIGSADNQTLSNTNLSQYDGSVSGDEDIFFDVDTGVLTVDHNATHSSETLYIQTGDTYQPGGNALTYKFVNDGTITIEANTLRVNSDFNNNSTFSTNTGTLILGNVNGGAFSNFGTGNFYNVTIGETSGSSTRDSYSNITVLNDLVIDYGTYRMIGSYNLTVTGNMTINTNGYFTKSTGTLTFNGTTAKTLTDNNPTKQNLGIVSINKTDSGAPSTNNKITLGSSVKMDRVTIDGTGGSPDTLALGSSGYTLELANAGSVADVLTVTGTLTIGTSTIKYSATNSGGDINVNNLPYSSLEVSGSETYVLTGNQTSSNAITGNLTIGSGATLDVTTAPYGITLNGNWSNSGTFTARTGTVTIGGSGTSTISGTTTFNTFTSTAASKTIKFQKHTANVPYFTFTTFTLTGGGAGTEINLESDTGSSQWLANFTGAQSGSTYVNVKDSGCYSGTNDITLDSTSNDVSGNDTSCWIFSTNNAPNSPSSLAQKKTTDVSLSTGDWTNESSVKFTVTASDTDNPDTLYLCIEKDQLGTAFSDTEDSCGSGGAYSGSPITLSHTISGLTDGVEYHWQARVKDTAGAYSAWVQYGGNAESARDYGVDTSAPTGGTVFDGNETGVDHDFNDGSLDTLLANWSGFSDASSGILRYDYKLGTTVGGTEIQGITANGTSTSVNVGGENLQTSVLYYFAVRAVDNAGNEQTFVNADGQAVAPMLSFGISPSSVTFSNLNSSNSYTDTETTTLTTSTNAYNGYVVRAFQNALLTSTIYPGTTIANYSGGSYASPDEFLSGDLGFGYTSSDTSVQGNNIFGATPCAGGGNPPCYAPFSLTGPGDIIADHTATVSGSPISSEQFTITYKVRVDATQKASPYSTTIIYTIVPIF